MAGRPKRKAARAPLDPLPTNVPNPEVEYDDDEDTTFEAPRSRKSNSTWAWKKRATGPMQSVESEQGDVAAIKPTNTEEESERETSLDAVQLDDLDIAILEAVETTTRAWKNVSLGTATEAPVRDEQFLRNLARCEDRVRHVLTSRYESTLEFKDPQHSAMTATAVAMIRAYGVENMLKTFKECCPERTQEIIGRESLSASDLLEIQPPTPSQLSQSADYLSICIPTQAPPPSQDNTTDAGLYVGSATGIYGLDGRWRLYDTYKTNALDGVKTQKMTGTHLDFALQSNYTMHLRGWIFFSAQRFSNQQCMLWEGFGMDLFNTLHLEDEWTGRYRTQQVLLESAKAVPLDLAKPSWKGLNDAHALKQGVGPPNEYCHMKASGCSTEEASAGAEPGLFDAAFNKPIYLCRPCSSNFYEFRTVWNCQEDGRRCSRVRHEHKVLSTGKREDNFEEWKLEVVQKWTKQSDADSLRLNLFAQQNWKCPCGRPFHRPDTDMEGIQTFRGTLLQSTPDPTLGCDACYTDWSLHRPENATVLQLEEWKAKRAAFRAVVVAKPQHENCVCSTEEKPVLTQNSVTAYGFNDPQKVCKSCYSQVRNVIKTWDIDVDVVQDSARALRLFIGLRCPRSVQLERYPDSPNCPCAGGDERVPALVEWTVKDQFPLEEPKFVCAECRRAWARLPARFKTVERAQGYFN